MRNLELKENASALSRMSESLSKGFNTSVLRYNFLESLILAQDERWRRA